MRARRAAATGPGPLAGLRDAGELLAPAVAETVTALGLGGKDAAVAQLARRYAAAIDDAESPGAALRAFGPVLLKTLESMGATPAARAGKAAKPAARPPSRLDQLRDAREAPPRRRAADEPRHAPSKRYPGMMEAVAPRRPGA